MAETQACILYYDRRSICASMVRYTLANAGAPLKGSLPLSVDARQIDIFQGDQLSEDYLCEINPKGQVPVLLSPGFLENPISDSLDITYWLCDRYPSLRPHEHAAEITRLLRELHALKFFTLSMRNVPERAKMLEGAVQAKMNTPGLSDRHKTALEYKLTVTRSEKVEGVKPEAIRVEIERARTLLVAIDGIKGASNTKNTDSAWVFGTSAPTALDTTLVCFVARLIDVKLEEIVPLSLLQLTQMIRETKEFKEIWNSL